MLCRLFVVWMGCIALVVTANLPGAAVRGEPGETKLPETVVPLNRDIPRHKLINERTQKGNVNLIFIGDSITEGWETGGQEVWKKYYEPRKAMNAGISGDRTQHVLWRLDNGNVENLSPRLAVLMIGTNNFGAGKIDKDAPKKFTETRSGLKYRLLRKGAGVAPKATDSVRVNYEGWLNDGTVFDSSYERGEPTSFPLSAVIAGWTEGMQLVGRGGMIELEIPANLGYGARGRPGIPANAILHFLVELLEDE